MHQCTTDVLCNLAGLIFGLAFHPSSFLLKTNTISLLSKAGVFYVSFCAFECEIIFHGHPTIKKKKKLEQCPLKKGLICSFMTIVNICQMLRATETGCALF